MTFTIAHLTDPHLGPLPLPRLVDLTAKRFMGFINWKRGRERLNDMPMLDRLVEDLKAQRPDHIAMTGDIVNIALPAEFEPAARWMRKLGDPSDVSFTPGNHDAYVQSALRQLGQTFAPWTSSDPSFEHAARFPFVRQRRNIVIIGLNSGVPTGPFMATGRLGGAQIRALAQLLEAFGRGELARVVLIHHPPLASGQSSMRSLIDAPEFEAVIRQFGAELILHGHNHKRLIRHLVSPAAKTPGGRVAVLGAPSASSTSERPNERAAYHLIALETNQGLWRVSATARGLMPKAQTIGERPPLNLERSAPA